MKSSKMEPTPDEFFLLYKEHLGSVRELVNSEGEIVQRYSYSAYGKTTIEDHDQSPYNKLVENRYAYTSREIEEETGDYYYRARYYSPDTGRFLSEDPIGFESGDFNFYRYVENNPILFSDPSGESGVTAGSAFLVACAAVAGYAVTDAFATSQVKNEVCPSEPDRENCEREAEENTPFENIRILIGGR